MAANCFEVPENETLQREFFDLLFVVREAAGGGLERVQNGTFTGPIRGLCGVEKVGLSWYNFDSR